MAFENTAKHIAKILRDNNIPVISIIEIDNDGDSEVLVTSKIHVQVGRNYMAVVREKMNGEFEFYKPAIGIDTLIFDVNHALVKDAKEKVQ